MSTSDDNKLPTLPERVVEGHYDLLSIKDLNNPDSVINLVPTWLATAIGVITDDTLDMVYDSLRKIARPTAVEEKLRHSFWNEYKRIIHDKRKPSMSVNNIIGGICSLASFQKIAASTHKLAYILQPPPSVDLAFDELIHKGLNEMLVIMNQPLVDPNGDFDLKLATLKSKLLNDALVRRNGAAAQNINIRAQSQSQTQHHINMVHPPQQSEVAQIIDVIQPAKELEKLTTFEIEAALAAEEVQGEQV